MRLRELCEKTNIPYDSKNPKRSLDKIKKFYVIEQNGTRKDYIFIRKKEADEIQPSKLVPYKSQFHVSNEDKHKSGIYKIELVSEKIVYIGQTTNFYCRFCRHCNYSSFSSAKTIIKEGAIFSIIEIQEDQKIRYERESYWSDEYKNMGYQLLNNEDVLYKPNKHSKLNKYDKLREILRYHNMDLDEIEDIIEEFFKKE